MNAADGFGSETKLGPLEGAALLAGRSSFRNAAQRSSYKGLRKVVDGYFPMQAEKGDAQGRTSEPHGAEEESDGTEDESGQAAPINLTTILLVPLVFCCVCTCVGLCMSPGIIMTPLIAPVALGLIVVIVLIVRMIRITEHVPRPEIEAFAFLWRKEPRRAFILATEGLSTYISRSEVLFCSI